MAIRDPHGEHEYLALLARSLVELQEEAARLNRRLRNARAAIRRLEDELAALAEAVRRRLESGDE